MNHLLSVALALLCALPAAHAAPTDLSCGLHARLKARTEAAAGVPTDPQPEPMVFRADRPFLFAILENATHTVLFLGRLENPATP